MLEQCDAKVDATLQMSSSGLSRGPIVPRVVEEHVCRILATTLARFEFAESWVLGPSPRMTLRDPGRAAALG